MLIVLALLVGAVALFATERLPVDLVALLVMSTLMLVGIITPQEGLAGFSNMATVTVGAMFVLSAGLFRTGVVNYIGGWISRVGRRGLFPSLVAIMLVAGGISAFINNTAAVAIFIPIVLELSREARVSPSKLLIPLSFASMFGGVCTLIGTSTNILVSTIAANHGQPAFRMFEFAPLGLVLFLAGFVYMLVFGIRLIPVRRTPGDLTQNFRLNNYLTELVVLPGSAAVGVPLIDTSLVRDYDVDVLEIFRDRREIVVPVASTVIHAGDVLRVRGDVRSLTDLEGLAGMALKPRMKWRDNDLESLEALLIEAVVAPNSVLEGRSLRKINFRKNFGANVLALRHRGELMRNNLADTPLRAGDALLVELRRDQLDQFKRSREFVIVSEVGLEKFRERRALMAMLIIAGVVLFAALGVLPIVVSAVVGCVLMILLGCLTLEEAYGAIEWRVIFLLAGVLTLGLALEKTGAAQLLSSGVLSVVGGFGPFAIISAFYLLTSLLTEAMSNNATAALMAPIAIATADSLGVDARPLLMAVAFAASASFMTPVGYQTNTLIYGPGHYHFSDFLRVGAPLNLMFWLLATILIPVIWPL